MMNYEKAKRDNGGVGARGGVAERLWWDSNMVVGSRPTTKRETVKQSARVFCCISVCSLAGVFFVVVVFSGVSLCVRVCFS